MNLPLTATKIEAALDDFKHNQSGLPWQRVALQLLRPRFPNLVAHHITADQGADAISYGNDSNGETVAFGCSITCTKTKIREDCQEIERSGKKVYKLIFATSASKTQVHLAPWVTELESQFKIRIDVLEREHFVQLLLRPENHWICRDNLHISIGDGTSHDEKIAAASLANRMRWRKQNEIDLHQLIDLRYFVGNDEPIDLERLVELVKARVDIILTGQPGAGKNVSLAQLAERLVAGPVMPFIVSLGILLASDAPEAAIALIERVKLPVRDVIELLAASRRCEAIDYLLRIQVPDHAMDTYIRVLKDNPTDGIVDFFVNAILTGAPVAKRCLQGNNHWDVVRMVAAKAAVNPIHFEKLKLHVHVDAEKIVARWLASVFAEIGTKAALFAILELIGEKHWPETRGSVMKAVFEACSTRQYLDGSEHSYTVEPVNSDEVRRALLAIAANDALRKKSALDLLASIASQRHEIGWANDETRHPGLGVVPSFVDMALLA